MERLTKHSCSTGPVIPNEQLGDLCMLMGFCDDYDFCRDCPVKTLLTRLCEYEDTGLHQLRLTKLRKSANTENVSRSELWVYQKAVQKLLLHK